MLTFLLISFLETIAIVFLEQYNQLHSLLIHKKATHFSFLWSCLITFFIKRRGELQHIVLVTKPRLTRTNISLQDNPHKDHRQSSQRVNYIANNLRLTKLSTKRRQHSFTHKKNQSQFISHILYSLKQKEWTATRGPYSVKWSNRRCLVLSLQLKTRSLLKHIILARCLMPSLALDSRD